MWSVRQPVPFWWMLHSSRGNSINVKTATTRIDTNHFVSLYKPRWSSISWFQRWWRLRSLRQSSQPWSYSNQQKMFTNLISQVHAINTRHTIVMTSFRSWGSGENITVKKQQSSTSVMHSRAFMSQNAKLWADRNEVNCHCFLRNPLFSGCPLSSKWKDIVPWCIVCLCQKETEILLFPADKQDKGLTSLHVRNWSFCYSEAEMSARFFLCKRHFTTRLRKFWCQDLVFMSNRKETARDKTYWSTETFVGWGTSRGNIILAGSRIGWWASFGLWQFHKKKQCRDTMGVMSPPPQSHFKMAFSVL